MEKKKNLLIADDEKYLHDLLTKLLPVDEFDIIHAYDGKETLRLAKEQLPDLIVLDIMMPLMDGRDICKKLKNDPETKNIKDLSSASLRNWNNGILEWWNNGFIRN